MIANSDRSPWRLILLGFALRLIAGLAAGPERLDAGYTVFFSIAKTWLAGGGLCISAGTDCAVRMPLYSIVLAPLVASGWLYPFLPIVQAALGAAIIWIAWLAGTRLFGARAGRWAAALAAFSPYAIIHDTAAQDTVLVNFLVAAAVCLLIEVRYLDGSSVGRADSTFVRLATGLAVALSLLASARLAAFAPLAVWCAATGPSWRTRLTRAATIALPIVVLAGGWAIRNWQVVGAPVLTTVGGQSLWTAHNDWTFSQFPDSSIDASVLEAYAHLTDAQSATLNDLQQQDVARDRALTSWGVEYMAAHPTRTILDGLRKLSIALFQFSPSRGAFVQIGYTLVYGSLLLLAAAGWSASRRAGGQHTPVMVLFAAFAFTTFVFWAHTSHKSHIDLFLFVYAAPVIDSFMIWAVHRTPRLARVRAVR